MYHLKSIFFALVLSFTVSASFAQGSKTGAAKSDKSITHTEAKATPATTKSQPASKAVKTGSKTETKQTTIKRTEKKPADARTKTGDKIDRDKKGPHGETVYTGERGGKYYLDKSGKHIYIK